MCRMFSALMKLNKARMGPEIYQRELRRAIDHLSFALEVYRMQAKSGRFFLHEHPATASSWKLDEVIQFIREFDAHVVVGDLCLFGKLETRASHL